MDIDHDDGVIDFESAKFLERFESQLDADVLQSFKISGPEWTGRSEDTSLFEFWEKIGSMNNNETNNEPFLPDNEIVFEYIDDTTYEECFQRGQNIEIVSLDNVIQNDLHTNVQTNVGLGFPTTVIASHSPENDDDFIDNSLDDQMNDDDFILDDQMNDDDITDNSLDDQMEIFGDVSIEMIENVHVQTDNVQLNDDLGSDEEITTNLVNATATSDNSHIPSGFPNYFRDALFWPGRKPDNVTSVKSDSKRKSKEKVPAVLISKDFIDYLKKKEDEKERLETEKAERKIEREMKKLEKQQKEQEKEKELLERKLEKQLKAEEKEKEKIERQMEREAKKIEKQKKEVEKAKEKELERKKKVELKKTQKCGKVVGIYD